MFAIEFDHRSDGGPRLVGPFETRDAANEHADGLGLRDASFCVVPLADPSEGRA